jgi:hypothetical protein
MGRLKSFKSGISDLWNIIQASHKIWQILVVAGLTPVVQMLSAKAGASPVEATAVALLVAVFLVLCLIYYRLYWLNVSIEFKPSEHSSFFYEWGVPSQDEAMVDAFYGKQSTYSTIARVRLRVYGGDTVEGVTVKLTDVKDCEELKGILPFNLRFKDDIETPCKTSIELHPEDDQFVDVASWKWNSASMPTIVFHAASLGDKEVPLKPYEITLRLTGKNIRSESKKFWIGIGDEDKPELGVRKGLFSMRALSD